MSCVWTSAIDKALLGKLGSSFCRAPCWGAALGGLTRLRRTTSTQHARHTPLHQPQGTGSLTGRGGALDNTKRHAGTNLLGMVFSEGKVSSPHRTAQLEGETRGGCRPTDFGNREVAGLTSERISLAGPAACRTALLGLRGETQPTEFIVLGGRLCKRGYTAERHTQKLTRDVVREEEGGDRHDWII